MNQKTNITATMVRRAGHAKPYSSRMMNIFATADMIWIKTGKNSSRSLPMKSKPSGVGLPPIIRHLA